MSTSKKIALLCLLCLPALARADVYSYIDARGVRTFTDIPPDGRSKPLWKGAPRGASLTSRTVDVRLAPAVLRPEIEAAARANSLDPALLHALISVESGFNPQARSPRGALGLTQLMPDTARRYGVRNAFDPRDNLQGGARYLRDLLTLFNEDVSLALAAYNAGENAVIRHGKTIPPYRETERYVPEVLAQFAMLRHKQAAQTSGNPLNFARAM